MAKAVFFSIPAHGHINPTLVLVRELTRLGEEVHYFSTEAFRKQIEGTGAVFHAYRKSADFDATAPGKNIGRLYYTLSAVTRGLTDELLRDMDDIAPDYLIHDALCLWGKNVARLNRIPAIASVSTFAFTPEPAGLGKTLAVARRIGTSGIRDILAGMRIQKELRNAYGIPPSGVVETMMNEEDLNIVYTSRAFQPRAERFDDSRYAFVGPSIEDRRLDDDATDYGEIRKPIIYISLGTIWRDESALKRMVDALADPRYTLIASGSASSMHCHGDGVIIKSRVNQIEVLKRCSAFVTHGGMNSVSEALYWEVPMLTYPFQAEQEAVADRLQELGCAIRLHDLGAERIRAALHRLLSDPRYRENCASVSRTLKEAGGSRAAAARILAFVRQPKAASA